MAEGTQSLRIEEVIAGDDAQTIAAVARRRKIRTVGVMGFVAALLIAGLGFVGYNVLDIRAASNAKVDYENAYEAYLASVSQLDESLVGVSNTVNECRNSVADQGVCDSLDRANVAGLELSNTRLDKADIHDKTTDQIRGETKRLRDAQSVVEAAREALIAALDPVAQSQVDKVKLELDAAVEAAEGAIGEAQRAVDEVGDEVADPKVREAAIEAIKNVRTQIDGAKAVTGADTAAYTAAVQQLNAAVEALQQKVAEVQYSHQVWEQEKREAEARASAEASYSAAAAAAEEEARRRGEEGDVVEEIIEEIIDAPERGERPRGDED